MWKTILNHRHLIQDCIKCELGNGDNASFWFDCWSDFGSLFHYFGNSGPAQTGIPFSAKVIAATNSVGWILRQPRTQEALNLAAFLTTIHNPRDSSEKDSYYLEVDGKKLVQFETTSLWDKHRPRDTLKNWASTIWFKFNSPKQAFTIWVANWDRLPTKNRLIKWGLHVQPGCGLCSNYDESRDHLFLRCSYSSSLWRLILQRLGMSFFQFFSWNALIQWASYESRSTPKILKRFLLHNTIDQLWRERNIRLHDNISRPPEVIFMIIDRIIRDTILANKNRRSFKNLMQIWLNRS